jgi:predicted transcriptional regulator
VKEALTHYISLEDERHRQTQEALAEVDAGKTIGQTDIEAWAAQLGVPRRKKRRA